MKNKNTLLTLAVASLAIAANPAMAADKASTVTGKQYSSSSSSGDVIRVSKDRLENITTAQDILGSSVYDWNGDKIGDVKDISLGRKIQSISGSQVSDTTSNQSSLGGSQVSDTTGNQSPYAGSQVSERTDTPFDGNQDSDRTGHQSQSTNYTQNDNNDSNQNRIGSNRHNNSGMMPNNGPEPYVFISIGGILGMGDDVVRVPMSSLSRSDTEKDRLILQGYSKDNVVAIAEQDAGIFDVNDYEYDNDDRYDTSRAKRAWNDSVDTTAIREALMAEDGLGRTDAARISVARDGEHIILSGSVKTENQKKKAGEIAMKHSEMTVNNEIKVNKK